MNLKALVERSVSFWATSTLLVGGLTSLAEGFEKRSSGDSVLRLV